MRVFTVLLFIGAACAVPRQSMRIVGGESTTIENYPFVASMLFIVEEESRLILACGGTLITETSIVSAAHCYYGIPISLLRVRLGSTFAYSGGNIHRSSRIILHDEFNWSLAINDVAMVKLINPAVISNRIDFARIAGPQYILPDNTLVHAVGWGDTELIGNPSDVLQHVAVKIINHQICTERYAYLQTLPNMAHIPSVTPEMLCSGILDIGGKDTCQGDSGGPVIHNKDVLVGITSWAFECGHPTYPGVKARVSSYADWIHTHSQNK